MGFREIPSVDNDGTGPFIWFLPTLEIYHLQEQLWWWFIACLWGEEAFSDYLKENCNLPRKVFRKGLNNRGMRVSDSLFMLHYFPAPFSKFITLKFKTTDFFEIFSYLEFNRSGKQPKSSIIKYGKRPFPPSKQTSSHNFTNKEVCVGAYLFSEYLPSFYSTQKLRLVESQKLKIVDDYFIKIIHTVKFAEVCSLKKPCLQYWTPKLLI